MKLPNERDIDQAHEIVIRNSPAAPEPRGPGAGVPAAQGSRLCRLKKGSGRAVYITQTIINKVGPTEGCNKCANLKGCGTGAWIHSDACRARIDALIDMRGAGRDVT